MTQFGNFLQTALPIFVMVIVLIWGLRLVARSLSEDDDRLGASFLREKVKMPSSALLAAVAAANSAGTTAFTDEQLKKLKSELQADISFSRVAGAIGAVSMAAFFAGLGVWCFFAINDTALYPTGGSPVTQTTLISRIADLGTFIAAGAALFLPYAFNRISNIFQ